MSEYIGGLSDPFNQYAYRCTKCKTVLISKFRVERSLPCRLYPPEEKCDGVLSYEGPTTTTCESKT